MNTVPLCTVAEIIMGTAPPGDSYNLSGDGLALIAGAGDYGPIHPAPKKWTTKASAVSRPGDLIVCVRATIGDLNWSDREYCLGRGVAALRPRNGKLESRYLGHFMEARKEALAALGTGSTFPAIRKNDIETFEIPLPPLPEQKRIADILDKADAIRRKRCEVSDLADSLLPAIFTELFGRAGNAYEAEPLDRHLEFLTSGSRGWAEHYVKSGKRFLRSLDVQMNRIGSEDIVYVNPPPGTEADRTRVRDGDVLITITGSRIGRVAFVPESFGEAYVSQHVAIARLKSSLLPRYCSMFLSLADGGQRQIAKSQYGQTKPGLSLTNIREFLIPIPPVSEQERFLAAWDRHAELMGHQARSSTETQTLFDSLLQRAFRGEL